MPTSRAQLSDAPVSVNLRSMKPVPAHIRVMGDPGGKAFYGWRRHGVTQRTRTVTVQLPGRLPTGPIWAQRLAGGRPHWYVPEQRMAGNLARVTIRAGTSCVAAAPVVSSAPGPLHLRRGGRQQARRVVVLGGQHPGEDTAIRCVSDMGSLLLAGHAACDALLVPLVNRSGWLADFTRETGTGIDLNRSWHMPGLDNAAEDLRAALLGADFVLDVHGDEWADRPYAVWPQPAHAALSPRITRFSEIFALRAAMPLRRPRPVGAGEDDPGILVNWLARRGVPGLMLELPMRHAVSRRSASFAGVRALERRIAAAAVAALGAVSGEIDDSEGLRGG